MARMTLEKARGIRAQLQERAAHPDSVLGGSADLGPVAYAAKRAETVAWARQELEKCEAWIERQERMAARQPEPTLPTLCGSCFTHHAGECY